eukprot:COSAG02_NODE_503_length_20999_cov_7.403110_21_plen_74_part_00
MISTSCRSTPLSVTAGNCNDAQHSRGVLLLSLVHLHLLYDCDLESDHFEHVVVSPLHAWRRYQPARLSVPGLE